MIGARRDGGAVRHFRARHRRVAGLGLLAVAERSYLPHNEPMRSTQSGGSDSPRSRWNDPDKDNFEGTTRHQERWVVRGANPSDVCQRLAACLSTTADGPAVKARKGSRLIYGLMGASFTPRVLLPVKLWVSAAPGGDHLVEVCVIAKSGAAEMGIDGLVRGPKRFQAAFDFWLARMRRVVVPVEPNVSATQEQPSGARERLDGGPHSGPASIDQASARPSLSR